MSYSVILRFFKHIRIAWILWVKVAGRCVTRDRHSHCFLKFLRIGWMLSNAS